MLDSKLRHLPASKRLHPLPPAFYDRPVITLARALLGRLLVRRQRGVLIVGRIVETEAYGGRIDPSSHSFRGQTPRCASMFGPCGRLYVYFTYGNHYCANVIGGSRRDAAAVLLRAVEPVAGIPEMRELRLARTKPGATAKAIAAGRLDAWLARGPGNLTAAFGLDRAHDRSDLLGGEEIWIADGARPRRALWSPRIGLGATPSASWSWRCFDPASAAVTRIPAGWPRIARASPTLAEARSAGLGA